MSLKKNYLYNLVYQVLILLLPLITIPYVSRVLGSSGIGINAFTYSIIQYFVLFSAIGISIYGNRKIAYVRNNKKELQETFWSIFWLKGIMTFISLVLFLLFLFLVDDLKIFYLLQSFYIFAVFFDVNWFFMGIEDFKKTVLRNIIIKLISTVAIFIFVKDEQDLWKYVLLLSLSQLLGNMLLIGPLFKVIRYQKVSFKSIFSHFKPTISLFIPQISIQIYLVLNKTMLGIFGTNHDVGIFENSDKMLKLVLAIVTATGIVMLPRVSNTFKTSDMEKVNIYLYQSFRFVTYLAFPLSFGMFAIIPNLVPWFFGNGFLEVILISQLMAPIIILIAWSNVLGTQYLLPINKTTLFTISVTSGAIVNLIFNFILIPKYYVVGAAISTVIAEFIVVLVQYILIKKNIQTRLLFKGTINYFISSLIMALSIVVMSHYQKDTVLTTLIQITLGMVIYVLLNYIFKDTLQKRIFGMIFKFKKVVK